MPFVRSGGLGDVAGALPKALNAQGHDCRVIIPFYKEEIKETYRDTVRFVASTFVDLSWRRQYCGVYEAAYDGVTYYFVDNEYYFKRKGLYGHFDDGERFAFFSKAVLEVLPLIDFFPDVIHANDWHTALTPVFLDVFYRASEEYQRIKTVFTIHNIEFQGKYGDNLIGDILGLPDWARPLVMNGDCVNYMKGGIESSNAVTTVSETYAQEILDPLCDSRRIEPHDFFVFSRIVLYPRRNDGYILRFNGIIVLFPLVFVVGSVDFAFQNLAELNAVFLQFFKIRFKIRFKIFVT